MNDINTLRTVLTNAGIGYAEDRELDNLEVHVKAAQPAGATVVFNFTELGRLTDICVMTYTGVQDDDDVLENDVDSDIRCDRCGKLITDTKNDLYHTSGRVNGVVNGHVHFCAACAIQVNMPIMDLTAILPRVEAAPAALATAFDDEASDVDPYEGLVGYKSAVWITEPEPKHDTDRDEEAHY